MNKNRLSRANDLLRIVQEVLDLNIMLKNRKRRRVEGRIIYSKILREEGYTFPEIGSLLSKDHSTIIHYCNVFDDIIEYNPDMKKNYNVCRRMFVGEPLMGCDDDCQKLITQLSKAREEIYLLTLKCEELANYKRQKEMEEEKFGSIYKLIRERTPEDMEDVVERRINAMFNTSYNYQEA